MTHAPGAARPPRAALRARAASFKAFKISNLFIVVADVDDESRSDRPLQRRRRRRGLPVGTRPPRPRSTRAAASVPRGTVVRKVDTPSRPRRRRQGPALERRDLAEVEENRRRPARIRSSRTSRAFADTSGMRALNAHGGARQAGGVSDGSTGRHGKNGGEASARGRASASEREEAMAAAEVGPVPTRVRPAEVRDARSARPSAPLAVRRAARRKRRARDQRCRARRRGDARRQTANCAPRRALEAARSPSARR